MRSVGQWKVSKAPRTPCQRRRMLEAERPWPVLPATLIHPHLSSLLPGVETATSPSYWLSVILRMAPSVVDSL